MKYTTENLGVANFKDEDFEIISSETYFGYRIILADYRRLFVCQDLRTKRWHIDARRKFGTFSTIEQAIQGAIAEGMVSE